MTGSVTVNGPTVTDLGRARKQLDGPASRLRLRGMPRDAVDLSRSLVLTGATTASA